MSGRIDIAASLAGLISPAARVGRVVVGVDAVDIARLRRLLDSSAGPAFLNGAFTDSEISDCHGVPDRVAARWAAKEAVVKAIGTGFQALRPKMIEISRDSTGSPTVRVANCDSWPLRSHLWTWKVSLTHDGNVALAVALALAEPRQCDSI